MSVPVFHREFAGSNDNKETFDPPETFAVSSGEERREEGDGSAFALVLCLGVYICVVIIS